MKALVKAKAEKGIWLQDIPKPTIGHNDVLIKIKKTAICGTDAHIYNWDAWAQKTIQVPMAIGHEFMGEIVEVGDEVTGLKIGQRVSGEGHITCGYCRKCRAGNQHLCRNTIGLGVNRQGCFAEYLSFPAKNVYPLPDNIPDNIAAFLDPLGNAVHTALSFDLVGEDVLITGAGPIGIMAAAICKKVGARFVVITDVNEYRLELAKKIGDITTVNPTKISLDDVMKNLGIKEGFDVGLEMSGNGPAFNQMLEHMNHGGRIAILGIPSAPIAIDWNHVIFKGLILKGIYGREMFDTWYKMIMLLQSGLNVAPVLTHEFHYTEFQKAFDAMASGQSGKVILHWN
ncbi:MAG TPA: L-threonine 3-dehydrogenase [Gammaproteobacteria bacterium]|nr:L-threonine 3-dehydrogenase [Gammaproteobacteria bacterium]